MRRGYGWSEMALMRNLAEGGATILEDHTDPAPLAVSLILPFPLTTWDLYIGTGKSKRLSKAGEEYKTRVVQEARRQYKGRRPMQGSLKVTVKFHAPDPRWRDIHDNFHVYCVLQEFLKEAGIYTTQNQTSAVSITKAASNQPGFIAIQIESLTGEWTE